MIPQLIMIIVFAISFGIHIAKHGEEKDEKYNAFVMLLAIISESLILYLGGFWNID